MVLFFYEGNDYQDNYEEFQNKILINISTIQIFLRIYQKDKLKLMRKITEKIDELIIKAPEFYLV